MPTLRKKVGMVFQKSNPFPMSIRDNVIFGPRRQGIKNRELLDQILQDSLRKADLWDEAKDRGGAAGSELCGGGPPPHCIDRALET